MALGVKPGDDLLLRIVKHGLMPYDAPLSSRKEGLVAASLVTVKTVLSDAQLGRFSLQANQTAPYNVFVDRTWLQEQTELAGLANLIVIGSEVTLDGLPEALARSWDLEHVGLRLRAHPQTSRHQVSVGAGRPHRAAGGPPSPPPLSPRRGEPVLRGRRSPFSSGRRGPGG
jgi:hypothetical protein